MVPPLLSEWDDEAFPQKKMPTPTPIATPATTPATTPPGAEDAELDALAAKLAIVLSASLEPAQVSALLDLRVKVQRGGYADDGGPAVPNDDDHRMAFARWLVSTGRINEGGSDDGHAAA